MLHALAVSPSLRAWGLLLLSAVLLTLVTRTWFNHWLLGGVLAHAGRFQRQLLQLIRTPGNVVHEGGHAVGFLLAGYRVTRISFWFIDPQERGFCEAGRPWAPWACSFLSRLIASPAPLFAGALVLRLGAQLLEVPTQALNRVGLLPLRLGAEALSAVIPGLSGWVQPLMPRTSPELAWAGLETLGSWLVTPWGALQAVGFVFLLLSLSLDLGPSWEDTRSAAPALAVVTVVLVGAVLVAQVVPGVQPFWRGLEPELARAIVWVTEPLSAALLLLVAAGLLLTPLRLLAR